MGKKTFSVDHASIRDLLDRYKLSIPEYQRGYVWNKDKKYQLMDSLFRGFPIGAITLYKDNNNVQLIIDGLQRLNTMKLYYQCPSSIIKFNEFYNKIEKEVLEWKNINEKESSENELKRSIKKWYLGLDEPYKFEKYSFFIKNLNSNNKLCINTNNIESMEQLLNILNNHIVIEYDTVPLIIYEGDRNNLSDLFRNINTGSVALSSYEIYQSMWIKFKLNKKNLSIESKMYEKALKCINDTYIIESEKENNTFDIFKNLIGLNFQICCIKDVNILFRYFTILSNNTYGKLYDNDSVAFEIYSTLICKTSNRIDEAVRKIFIEQDCNKYDNKKIDKFIADINFAIIDTIKIAISEIAKRKLKLQDSRYHSLYLIYGLFNSRYIINVSELIVEKRNKKVNDLYKECFKYENDWFVDKNRQLNFFKTKINDYNKYLS